MWHKNDGDGVLEGANARLLKVAVAAYVENLREPECWDDNPADQEWVDEIRSHWLDVKHVARMEHGQRIHMIATVVHALLERSIAAPALTADSEATVYQIYRFLCHAIDIEHDTLNDMQADEKDPAFGKLLVSTRIALAAKEVCPGCDGCGLCDLDMGGPLEMWHAIVEDIADTVLWDRDWQMEDSLADSSPTTTRDVKTLTGIEEGYFTTPVEEPSIQQVAQAKAYLKAIADEILAEDEETGKTDGIRYTCSSPNIFRGQEASGVSGFDIPDLPGGWAQPVPRVPVNEVAKTEGDFPFKETDHGRE